MPWAGDSLQAYKAWRELVDGFGLCSPGRWRPLARDATASSSEWEHSEAVREILLQAVRNLSRMLERRPSLLPRAGCFSLLSVLRSPSCSRADRCIAPRPRCCIGRFPEGSLSSCTCCRNLLRSWGIQNYRILDHGDESFAQGVPLGWDRPLPRTPQVFPKRTTLGSLIRLTSILRC